MDVVGSEKNGVEVDAWLDCLIQRALNKRTRRCETLTYDHHACLQPQPQSQVLVEILVSASSSAYLVIIDEIFTTPRRPTCAGHVMYIKAHRMAHTMWKESGTKARE